MEALYDTSKDTITERCPNCGSTAQYRNGSCGCGHKDTGPITSSDLWQEIAEMNTKLGRELGMPKQIDVEEIKSEVVIKPRYKVYSGNINGKASYTTVGKFEYQIRKLLGSRA